MNIENIKQLFDIEVRYIDGVKGFGVFTNQTIPKSSIVEVCYCLKLTNTSLGHPSYDYLFSFTNTEALLPLGYGSIYNHSDTANLGWKVASEEYNIMHFISNKDIAIGEELTHNYGPLYWKSRNHKKTL
jgi:hypothetical protein